MDNSGAHPGNSGLERSIAMLGLQWVQKQGTRPFRSAAAVAGESRFDGSCVC